MRVEVGPKDLEKNSLTVVMRDNGSKSTVSVDEYLAQNINGLLTSMHDRL